jgi:serine/threonine protein kinase
MADSPGTPSQAPDATTDFQPAAPTAIAVETLGRFQLRAELGRGAFGIVYRAYDPTLEREVALKVTRGTPGEGALTERFLREARAAAKLRHPHAVTVYDCGTAGDTLYIALELVDGQTLADRMAAEQVNPRQAAQWVRDLALALHTAHEQGILHRDVKPANILLSKDGRALLTDFGLAGVIPVPTATGASPLPEPTSISATAPLPAAAFPTPVVPLTQQGMLLGPPAYMAPEQARGDHTLVSPASDQYSLGVVLYEMLTGRKPYDGTVREVLAQITDENMLPPRPRVLASEIPLGLEAITLKAMHKQPCERYASSAEMDVDLQRWLKGVAVQAPLHLQGEPVRCCPACSRHNTGTRKRCMFCGQDISQVEVHDSAGAAHLPTPRKHRQRSSLRDMPLGVRIWELIGWSLMILAIMGYLTINYLHAQSAYTVPHASQIRVGSEAITVTQQEGAAVIAAPPSFVQTLPDRFKPQGFMLGLVIGLAVAVAVGLAVVALMASRQLFWLLLTYVRWLVLLPPVIILLLHESGFRYVYDGPFELNVQAQSATGRTFQGVPRLDIKNERMLQRFHWQGHECSEPVKLILGSNGDAPTYTIKGRYEIVKSPLGRTKSATECYLTYHYTDKQPGPCRPPPGDKGIAWPIHGHVRIPIPFEVVQNKGKVQMVVIVP